MRLLVDSHVALWWLGDNTEMGPECRSKLEQASEVFFSAVTPWELGIKVALGRLSLPGDVTIALEASGFQALPITTAHAKRAPTLPMHHRDPFDRMLVAQAQLEVLALVTADQVLSRYDVELVAARS